MWNDQTKTVKTIAALAIAMALSATSVAAAERTWTRSKILAIADKKAQQLGYDVEHMSVSFDSYNSQWSDHLRGAGNSAASLDLQARLKNREYWAVYYGPMAFQLGGDLWIFIDRNTGEVIEWSGGQ